MFTASASTSPAPRTVPRGRRAARLGRLQPWLCALPLLLAAPLHANTIYGVIETTDGKALEGDILLEPGAFGVQTTNGTTVKIGFDQLASFRLQERPKPPPPEPPPFQTGLRATYFAAPDLSGMTWERVDREIDFDWQGGAPITGMNVDRFSARWEGLLEAPSTGNFIFHLASDDGVRLWIDNRILIDDWRDRSRTESRGEIILESGKRYPIKLEYYENAGEAMARLEWTEPGQPRALVPSSRLFHETSATTPPPPAAPPEPRGLLALYFKTPDLSGSFIAVTNPAIHFNWNHSAPLPGIGPDRFSVRWLGKVVPKVTEPHTFHAEADDGMRLWIDGKLLLKVWQDGVYNLSTQPVPLEAGRPYDLQFEMYDNNAGALAKLSWSSPSQPRAVIPPSQLLPVPPPQPDPSNPSQPAGVLLASGTFIAKRIHAADESRVTFSASKTAPGLPTASVARIHFHDLPPDKAKLLEPGRAGLLLQSGDFVDGEIRAISNGRVSLNSILFGLKRFGMDTALAAVFRDPLPRPAKFEILSRDHSRFLVLEPELGSNALTFKDPNLADFKVIPEDLVAIRRMP